MPITRYLAGGRGVDCNKTAWSEAQNASLLCSFFRQIARHNEREKSLYINKKDLLPSCLKGLGPQRSFPFFYQTKSVNVSVLTILLTLISPRIDTVA